MNLSQWAMVAIPSSEANSATGMKPPPTVCHCVASAARKKKYAPPRYADARAIEVNPGTIRQANKRAVSSADGQKYSTTNATSRNGMITIDSTLVPGNTRSLATTAPVDIGEPPSSRPRTEPYRSGLSGSRHWLARHRAGRPMAPEGGTIAVHVRDPRPLVGSVLPLRPSGFRPAPLSAPVRDGPSGLRHRCRRSSHRNVGAGGGGTDPVPRPDPSARLRRNSNRRLSSPRAMAQR